MKFVEVDPMWTFYRKAVAAIVAPLLLMFLVLGVGAAWGAASPMPEFQLAGIGDSLPMVRSEDFTGKVLLVNFWATWCPPCRQEIPSLIRLHEENSGKGFSVIGISMDKSAPDKVAKFVKKIGVNYPIAMGTNEIARSFGASGTIPSSFLVNASGRIVKRYPGYTSYEKMAKDLKEVLR